MPNPDPLDKLRKLAALRDDGVIDAGEFERLKAELLAQVVGGSGSGGQRDSVAPQPSVDSVAAKVAAARVTEAEVRESHGKVAAQEQQAARLAKSHQELAANLTSTQRRVRRLVFIQNTRRAYRHIALGRLAPVMVSTAVGMVLGVVAFGIFPFPTGIVLAGGFLAAGIALLAALHMFVVPRDELLAEQLAASQQELTQLQSQLPPSEQELEAAKQSLDEAQRRHLELTRKFDSRVNQLLTFDWRMLRGIPFEKFLKAIFENLGYEVRLTKMSGDQGVDLIAEKDGICIALQAKGYAENVGNSAVQQAHAGMTYHKCNRCAVVTNSRFTPSAIDLAARLGCTLIDSSQIEALILGEIRL